MAQEQEVKSEDIKPTIWDKYTHIDKDGKQVTNIKAIILHLHKEIQLLHEAMTYVAHYIDNEENKDKIILEKPGLILPE